MLIESRTGCGAHIAWFFVMMSTASTLGNQNEAKGMLSCFLEAAFDEIKTVPGFCGSDNIPS